MVDKLVHRLIYPTPRLSHARCVRSFVGCVCIVSGASSGIGLELARILLESGARVLLIARREEILSKLCRGYDRADYYPLDLRDREALDALGEYLRVHYPKVDYFFANAGKSINRSLHASSGRLHDFDRTMDVNYRSMVALSLALYPSLIEGRGCIVYSSAVSLLYPPAPGWAAYHASKGAADLWLRTARSEWAKRGISIRIAYLPLVATPMSAANPSYRSLPSYTALEAARLVLRLSLHPLRRSYVPWWARISASPARLCSPIVEAVYRRIYTR